MNALVTVHSKGTEYNESYISEETFKIISENDIKSCRTQNQVFVVVQRT